MRRNLVILAFALSSACGREPPRTSEANTAAANTMSPASSDIRTPGAVVEHHVRAMKAADIDAVMSDYADQAVVVTPPALVPDQTPPTGPGVYAGSANARRVFAVLTGKDNIDSIKSMATSIEPGGKDIAFLRWTQFKGTPHEVSGTDVFVVRDNKIVFQDIVPNPK